MISYTIRTILFMTYIMVLFLLKSLKARIWAHCWILYKIYYVYYVWCMGVLSMRGIESTQYDVETVGVVYCFCAKSKEEKKRNTAVESKQSYQIRWLQLAEVSVISTKITLNLKNLLLYLFVLLNFHHFSTVISSWFDYFVRIFMYCFFVLLLLLKKINVRFKHFKVICAAGWQSALE